MPKLTGIVESALYVDDLDRATNFYERVFGFAVMVGDARISAMKVCDGQVLLLFKRGASLSPDQSPTHDGSGPLHLAFSIPEAELPAWEKKLSDNGVHIEARKKWGLGGQSVYFRDPDNHLLELATPGVWPNY